MQIVVLVKPVPETTGDERFEPDLTVDRDASPAVINPNDEYAIEAALRVMDSRPATEVTLLTMAPPSATDTIRKALSMGATRAVLVTDTMLAGSCALSTARVLAAALATIHYDLVIAGVDSSDGRSGVVAGAVATMLHVPCLSGAAGVELEDDKIRVHRGDSLGTRLLEAALPAMVVVTQAVGTPRYPTLRGIMAARSKEILTRSLKDIGVSPQEVGTVGASTRVIQVRALADRPEPLVISATPDRAAMAIIDFLVARGSIK